MLGCCALTAASDSKRTLGRNVQNETKLILELLGEPATHQSIENRADGPRALQRRQPTVLEASCHLRSRPAMPETHRVRLKEGNALLDGLRIIREQAVTQGHQLFLVGQLNSGSLELHSKRGQICTFDNRFANAFLKADFSGSCGSWVQNRRIPWAAAP